jgi:hypothetical protein
MRARFQAAFRKHEHGAWQLVIAPAPRTKDCSTNVSSLCALEEARPVEKPATVRETAVSAADTDAKTVAHLDQVPPLATTEKPEVEDGDVRIGNPPPIIGPIGVVSQDRSWECTTGAEGLFLGCGSHRGPPWIWQDKSNQDFAFAIEHRDRAGKPWALVGVCDGVSASTWAERGAQHAASAFLGVVADELDRDADFAGTIQSVEKRYAFAERFHEKVHRSLSEDVELLASRRYVPADWRPSLYEQRFLLGSKAAEHRKEWLQTTLLGVALGPRGGFALLLGDGFVRIDRGRPGRAPQRKIVPIQASEDQPERRVSLMTTVDEVASGLRGILPDESAEVGVVVATDGVSKTPRHGLEECVFRSGADCAAYLEALAGRPKGDVESDNMSMAFAVRRVE